MSTNVDNDYGEKFDLWCRVYDPLELELSFVRKAIGPPPRRVLDVGAGTGRLAIPLASEGYCVTAVDRDERLLEVIKAKSTETVTWASELTILKEDFTSCTVLPKVDVVIFSWVLGFLGDRERALRKAEELTSTSQSPRIVVIQGCGESDYARIVRPFLRSRQGNATPKRPPAPTIREFMSAWHMCDYGLHDVPYVFRRFDEMFTVFKFALSRWHGVPQNTLDVDALGKSLRQYKRGDAYYVCERVNLLYLYKDAIGSKGQVAPPDRT